MDSSLVYALVFIGLSGIPLYTTPPITSINNYSSENASKSILSPYLEGGLIRKARCKVSEFRVWASIGAYIGQSSLQT